MISPARKFADGTPLFEFSDHFEQVGAVGFLEAEAARDIVCGRRIGPNLEKTKNVVGAQVRGSCHKLGPRAELCGRGGFYSLFFGERETFFGGMGLHRQANTRPASRPPSGWPDIPRKGNTRGGTTWPASHYCSGQGCSRPLGRLPVFIPTYV
jgi:hypothetical protein